jgi:hypothetical protein
MASNDEDFAKEGGDALEIEDDEFSEGGEEDEEDDDGPRMDPNDDDEPPVNAAKAAGGGSGAKKGDLEQNQHFDMAFEVNESEGDEVDSGEEEDIVANPGQAVPPQQNMKNSKPAALDQKTGVAGEAGEEEDKPLVGAYNPADYAGLQVSQDIKDLFNYITTFQP